MDFLSVPIFDWPIDWTDPVNGNWEFDLQELQIGFGPELLDPYQAHILHGWEFSLEVRDQIDELNTFLNGRKGRTNPFWMPGPALAFKATAGVSTSQFDVRWQNANATWQNHPAKYLYFSKDGQTAQVGTISAVADNGSGTERVTLAPALAVAVDQTWTVQPLWLVRLAEDIERIQILAEGAQRRSFRVVELPNDYTNIRTAAESVYLYRFKATILGVTSEWRYTSHPSEVVVSAQEWLTAPIEHKRISFSVKSGGQSEIIGDFDSIEPLRLAFLTLLMAELELEILKSNTSFSAPSTLFTGRVTRPELADKGRRLRANVISWSDALEQGLPGFFLERDCNYEVYEPNSCRADPDAKKVTATIVSVSGRQLVVTAAWGAVIAENWFTEGWIEYGAGINKQIRFIAYSAAQSGGNVTLELNASLTIAVGESLTLRPGCNGLRTTCDTKFGNLVNFGGVENARENLSLQAVPVKTATGGKK